jgi:predicted RNase H-like HicB family nuclease
MKYTIILTQEQSGNVSAVAPGLPECHVQASSRQEAIQKISQSIANIIRRGEVIQLDFPDELSSEKEYKETPWDLFGAHPHDSDWGDFFDRLEYHRQIRE